MKRWKLGLGILLISTIAFAATAPEKIRNDELQIGADGSAGDKVITIDVGDGASNPKITITQADKDFSFSKLIKTIADTIGLGDGNSTGDQCVTFDTGDAGSNKQLCILDTSKIATINSDLTIGNGLAADQEFTIDIGSGASNPVIKWDNAAQRLQFSNDGSSFKNIGSGGGGGGGINILIDVNPDFEAGDPPNDFISTGGTFVAETVNPGFGDQSGAWNASATTQFLRSTAVAIPEGLYGRSCSARIQYKWPGSATDLKWRVEDSSDVLIVEKDLAVAADWTEDMLFFTCPTSGNLRIEVESFADAALLLTDNWELGQVGFVNVSQAELIAQAYYANTTNCQWGATSTSYIDFPVDADCPAITVVSSTQTVDTTDNNLPDIDFDSLPEGKYLVQARVTANSNTGGASFAIRISDGTTASSGCLGRVDAITEKHSILCTQVFDYTSSGARNFKIQGLASAGDVRLFGTLAGEELAWTITKFPNSSAQAITIETIAEHWDVNIGGANPNLGAASISTYTEIVDAGLDMVLNTGSKTAEIPCSTTNPSTGLTCAAGSEGVGIAFTPATTGRFRVCAGFTHQYSGPNNGESVEAIFQWIETPNNAQTITSLGKSRVMSGCSMAGADASSCKFPHRLCGDFDFTSVDKKTLRLMYEQAVAGTVVGNTVLADRNAAKGQRDIHITVDKLDQQTPTPAFTDLTNSLNSSVNGTPSGESLRATAALLDGTGATSILSESGPWLDSLTDNGVGDYTLNITSGIFTVAPYCFVVSRGSNDACYVVTVVSTSAFTVLSNDCSTNAAVDSDFSVSCLGER